MRVKKSPAEIAKIKEAVALSVEAHWVCMKHAKPNMYEYELEAMLMQTFYRNGCRQCAYLPIIGSGKNSCVLHYIHNNQQMLAGELVLIDAGAEIENYAADITRTFPLEKSFNAPQRELYELVLIAQEAAITMLKPGLEWSQIQQTVVRKLTEGLCDLKILKGGVEENIEAGHYRQFYMHGAGHWLGLDVHDVGRYTQSGQSRLLEPGMVFTVEPGLYIRPDNNVDQQWWNIGIRIEDDILVT